MCDPSPAPYENYHAVEKAQLWVAGVEKPENVLSDDTRKYFEPPETSPRNQGFHWHGNARSYFRAGKGAWRRYVETPHPMIKPSKMITLNSKAFAAALCVLSSFFCRAGEPSNLVTNLEADKKQVVVAYGTSLTESGAWVGQMKEVLDKRYPGLATVINSGGSGQWSEWGVKNLDQRVIQKKPDTVFIEFSINDSVERFKGSVEIAKANLEAMIAGILKDNPACEIILMTMTPGDKYPEGHRSHRKDIDAHYGMYRSVAKGKGFLLIDHYPNWKNLQKKDGKLFLEYVPDAIHPTAKGCSEVVTPVILDALGLGRAGEEAGQATLAPTPPMGWNSWNCFHEKINEEQIRKIADIMVSSGTQVTISLSWMMHGWHRSATRTGASKPILRNSPPA